MIPGLSEWLDERSASRSYLEFGTCDRCLERERPLRETKRTSHAYVCAACDRHIDEATSAAAEVMMDEYEGFRYPFEVWWCFAVKAVDTYYTKLREIESR